MHIIILFCVLISTVTAMNYRQSRSMRRPDFEGKLKDSNKLFVTSNSITTTGCNLLCLSDIRCVSYFYIRPTGTCQLHSIVFYSQEETTLSSQTSYYQLYEDWCMPEDQHNLYRVQDTCYKFYTTPTEPYNQAVSYCQGKSETLIKIKTEEKYHHIKSFLLDEQKNTGIWDQFYVAAKNDTGTLLWSDGSPVIFTEFASGEPSSIAENCVTLHEIFSYKWNDVGCDNACHIICERFKN